MNLKIEELNIMNASAEEFDKIHEIFQTLLDTGGLLGMKNGSTNIHFDSDGKFQAVKMEYFPWKRRGDN